MVAWLTIDFTARRYGCLPSQLLKSGDTVDLRAAEIAVNYERWVKENPGIKNDHGFTQEQLLEKMQNAKNKQGRTEQQTEKD